MNIYKIKGVDMEMFVVSQGAPKTFSNHSENALEALHRSGVNVSSDGRKRIIAGRYHGRKKCHERPRRREI